MAHIVELKIKPEVKLEFEDIQWKVWDCAKKIDPKSTDYGFNLNSSFQSELYTIDGTTADSDLSWDTLISECPEYVTFCKKYNFYLGATMISRPILKCHRHGSGEYTITYPLRGADGLKINMVTPVNIAQLDYENRHEVKDGEHAVVDETYFSKTSVPFMLKANHFHCTEGYPKFINGHTIFTVWHLMHSQNPTIVDSFKKHIRI